MTAAGTSPTAAAPVTRTAALKARAVSAGFDLAGVVTLGPATTADAFDAWLARGFAGTMDYMHEHAEVRRDSRRPEPGMRSALVVALNYGGTAPPGPVARYARGRDYHRLMWDRLEEIGDWLTTECGARTRAYVDSAPILERDLARAAGLGWFGKNAMLIHPRLGSFFFIGALFTDCELEPDAPFATEHCGSCTRCLDACPTAAFPEPGVLDATRCISYLTIELRGPIPSTLREAIGERLYGCDVCQDVCPWNEKFARPASLPALSRVRTPPDPDPAALLGATDAAFRARFRGTAITRARREGVARNAAVALGNRRDPAYVPALSHAVSHDPDAVVRGHAAWALGQIGTPAAAAALRAALQGEPDASVRDEIAAALGAAESAGPA